MRTNVEKLSTFYKATTPVNVSRIGYGPDAWYSDVVQHHPQIKTPLKPQSYYVPIEMTDTTSETGNNKVFIIGSSYLNTMLSRKPHFILVNPLVEKEGCLPTSIHSWYTLGCSYRTVMSS